MHAKFDEHIRPSSKTTTMNDLQTFCELRMTRKPKFENLRQFFVFIGFNTTYINYHNDDVFK